MLASLCLLATHAVLAQSTDAEAGREHASYHSHDHDRANRSGQLAEVVITATPETAPGTVVTDPRRPRQPMPASDAADYLKTIAGFSAIRSGGSNSDPVFRGQFGSRLPILANGATLLGACPARMDSPSSYLSPDTFDELVVTKGPQTVLWGPGASAGVVRFERKPPVFEAPGVRGRASVLGASAGRNDQVVDVSAGNRQIYGRLTANRSHGQDYRDGNGRKVPSSWDKWNVDASLGVTPDPRTLLELSAGAGDGEARYGGRGMDGSQFKRRSLGLRFEKKEISTLLAKVEAQLYANHADHVMDNYSLRTFTPGSGMSMPMASNPDRRTRGGRASATLRLAQDWLLEAGVDHTRSRHSARSGSPSAPYSSKPRVRDFESTNTGLFGELTWHASEAQRVIGGLRMDRTRATRYAATSSMGGMGGMGGASTGMSVATKRNDSLPSGFLRWERDLADQTAANATTVYAGIGYVERFPDYWELVSPGNSAAASGNAYAWLQPERTTQIDIGIQHRSDDWQAWASAYAGQVRDYILFDYRSGSSMVRNVDARTAGLELGLQRRIGAGWSAQGSLAYIWARNRTDSQPLPQTPPLELRLGASYEQGPWTGGLLWRVVAAQHRHADGLGNVVGQDFGPSAGFGVLSLNIGHAISPRIGLTAGIDNLLDKTYAEHLNLAGNAGFGYAGSTRINEPGRTVWVRADIRFD
ncbi:TonB-dependent copper receptor [Corticibacter populi]|nr:TonB-dependent copper receptor [Corticibacter populi]